MEKKRGKIQNKGQVTIFVILAIAIVAVLIFAFLPNIQELIRGPTPDIEIGNCLRDNVQETMAEIMPKGGSLNPTAYILYDNETIEYLCYTSDWYQTCAMQKPMLKQSIEKEIIKDVQPKIQECIDDVVSDLRRDNYEVQITGANTVDVQLVLETIIVSLDSEILIVKDESRTLLENFETRFSSGYYEMIIIATSILNYEARYGDSAVENFMGFYPNLKIEKLKQSDGSTIYRITNTETEEVFQFASRSVAWPPGYVYG